MRYLTELAACYPVDEALGIRGVNSARVLLYWEIGHRIHREIPGQKRAEYGEEPLRRDHPAGHRSNIREPENKPLSAPCRLDP